MRTSYRWLLPLVAALLIGYAGAAIDLHNDEPQAAALVLLVGGFAIGCTWPSTAWCWALVLGVSIAVWDYLAPRLGLVGVTPAPFNAGALLALIPAFIGVYVGVGIRTIVRRTASNV